MDVFLACEQCVLSCRLVAGLVVGCKSSTSSILLLLLLSLSAFFALVMMNTIILSKEAATPIPIYSINTMNDTTGHETRQEHSSRFQSISLIRLIKMDSSEDFSIFKLKEGCPKYTMYWCIFNVIVTVLKCLKLYYAGNDVPLVAKMLVYASICVPVLGCMYTYYFNKYEDSHFCTTKACAIIWLADAAIVLQSILASSALMYWVLNRDKCISAEFCMNDFPKYTIPIELLVVQIVSVFAYPMFYTCHHASATLLAVVISFTITITTGSLVHIRPPELLGICMMGVVFFFALASHEWSVLSNYEAYFKFETALRKHVTSENNEYLLRIQTEQMRHMIGE